MPKQEYTNLGYVNGWGRNTPQAYVDCANKGHKHRSESEGKCLTREYCTICKIEWRIDSSD